MKIAAHVLVKNEAKFVWYSVMSVINHVDKVFLWDTGSIDGTIEIIKEIKKRYKAKVDLKFLDKIDAKGFTKIRQRMLEATKTDWFIVVDGDEVWWDKSIRKVVRKIKKHGEKIESIVVPTINLVGDIYHYQPEDAGLYELAGQKGHLNLRGVNRKIPGLASSKPHGTWGWVDEDNKMIQDRDRKKIVYLEAPYMHASFLQRAGESDLDKLVVKRSQKRKKEIGLEFPLDYYYPEVFFRERPEIVESVWEVMKTDFYLKSYLQTPLRKFKRKYLPSKIGY